MTIADYLTDEGLDIVLDAADERIADAQAQPTLPTRNASGMAVAHGCPSTPEEREAWDAKGDGEKFE